MTIETLRWVKMPDGRWWVEGLYQIPPISQAAYDGLPAHLKTIPVPSGGWKAQHYAELMTRAAGGPYADAWVSKLMADGVNPTEAIKLVASAAPPGKPATFPKLAAAMDQAGHTQAAQALRAGVQAPSATPSTSAASTAQAGSTGFSPVLMLGIGLLVLFAIRRGRS